MKLAVVNLTRTGMSGGYRKYLQELLPRLARHSSIEEIHVFIRPELIPFIATSIPATHCHPCEDTLAGRGQLKKTLLKLSPDVVFFPSLRGVKSNGFPSVFMIQNMEPLALPVGGNNWRESLKNLARRHAAKTVCNGADRVLAVSDYVKDFLVTNWHIPLDKIGVVYHGADNVPDSSDWAKPKAIPSEWMGNFLFTAGSIRPARGIEDLIKAISLLASAGMRLSLVIAGTADQSSLSYERKMKSLAQSLEVQGQIIWTGQLSSAEMSWCYTHAGIFVMTSRVEACPNIALEAMVHGARCIAADNPPLPEFFKNAALYYRPGDSQSLAAAINTFQASSPELNRDLRKRALVYAAQFTWDKTAEITIKELRMACQCEKK